MTDQREAVARGLTVALLLMTLSACSSERATCTRLRDGEQMHGTVSRYVTGEVKEYDLTDRNGILGSVTGENSDGFTCNIDGKRP